MACFCLIYIYFPHFWSNYIHSLCFFYYILLWIPVYLELVFLFLKKEFTLLVFSVFSFKVSIDFGTSRNNYTLENNENDHRVDFCAFYRAIRNWWEKPCILHVVKYTIRWESDGRKVSIRQSKMGTSFLEYPNLVDLTTFSHAMENSWGNPCISQIINYTIECEFSWKKSPILWEKYEYQFPRFSTYDGFCKIFSEINFSGFSHSMDFPDISHTFGKLTRKPMHYPYNQVCNRIAI